MVTYAYGPYSSSVQSALWAELGVVAGKWHRPFVVGGDFNIT